MKKGSWTSKNFYYYRVDQDFLVTVKPAVVNIHTMNILLKSENTST